MNIEITQGGAVDVTVALRNRNGSAYVGANGGSMTANLVDRKNASSINGDTLTCTDTGSADWAAGTVIIPVTAANATSFTVGNNYQWQLNVTESGGTVRKFLVDGIVCVRSAT